jgi:hypothetical protein
MTDTTLTDRYVAAALHGVPADERGDLELELRGSIADAVDARVAAGDSPEDAESAVLVELGDPGRLADRYTGRLRQLIGPTVYREWWRLLRVLLAVVVPIVVGIDVIAAVLDGDDALAVFGSAVAAAFELTVQLTFWVTLVFAVIERTVPGGTQSMDEWTLDDLPEVADRRVGVADTAFWLVTLALTVAAMLWQRDSTLVTVDGSPVAILEPDNWSFWWPFLIATLAAEAVLAVVVFRRGVWTPALLGVYVVLELAFTVPLLWLLSQDRVFNPEFTDQLDWGSISDPAGLLTTIVAVSVVAITVWDIGEKSVSVWRSRTEGAAPVLGV